MKTAVLFIHGFMGHPGEFKIIDNYFKSWGFETYSIILSGHNKKN